MSSISYSDGQKIGFQDGYYFGEKKTNMPNNVQWVEGYLDGLERGIEMGKPNVKSKFGKYHDKRKKKSTTVNM